MNVDLLAALVVAVPLLLAPASVPDAVFFNQVAALGLWGLWCAYAAPRGAPAGWPLRCALGALLLLAASALVPRILAGRSPTDGLLLLAACVVTLTGARQAHDAAAWTAWSRGWWIAGLGCVLVALVQYFAPSLADGWLIAANSSPGRAVGNMRQPNHLSTALLCATVMTASLWQAGRLRAGWGGGSIALMVFALALTASRTGMLSLALLVAWAALDRTLPRALRRTLAATPLIYAASWGVTALYAEWRHAAFFGAERLAQQGGDISSSRVAIWKNTLELIAQQPWAGVGYGNFNIAWTLTPFPDRPIAFFDHTHNAPLQLAVEIGVPATLLVLCLLGAALWGARDALDRAMPAATGSAAAAAPTYPGRAALAMLAVLAAHSLLEYPLWYAYFLLPAAWAFGVVLGLGANEPREPPLLPHARSLALRLAGVLMVAGALYAVWDHARVAAIFAPGPGAGSLRERIEQGRRSPLFGHHADYAAVTTEPRDPSPATFDRPLHQLVDVRLLQAYAEALHAAGREAEALYAAQRLREFRRADAQEWFAGCGDAEPGWQCETRPVEGLDWRAMEAQAAAR
ncbi:PglL family O-oligosaccharyltransferase [Rivibacter subsaxonicus]|uniref:O-antigen ligase n=1 Tax=Rivibacter subsaxonicus TaxID=457575 RepID=A0A4V2FU81_9BURK|nr:O-antigen ligase family protein [Rivibacter subsaxonicus]RZU00996.1 O-antigen ligase [Rivibacter subsaxonicus]